MGEHQATDIALKADVRNGVCDWFIHHLNASVTVNGCDARYRTALPDGHLVDQRIVCVSEWLGDVARLGVIGQLGQIHRAGVTLGSKGNNKS